MIRSMHCVPTRPRTWRATVAAGLAAACLSGAGAPPGAAQEGHFSDSVAVGWVYVPVVVRSDEGYVKGLKSDDFRLFVDDKPAQVESFETARARRRFPWSSCKTSRAAWGRLPARQQPGSGGVFPRRRASRRRIRAGIVRRRLGAGGRAFHPGHRGRARGDRGMDGLRHDRAAGRRCLAAGDHARAHQPQARRRPGDRRCRQRVDDSPPSGARPGAQGAAASLRARPRIRQPLRPRRRAADKVYRNADMLNLLARLSGGALLPDRRPRRPQGGLRRRCSDDLRHQYVLGFATAGARRREVPPVQSPSKSAIDEVVSIRRGYEARSVAQRGRRPLPREENRQYDGAWNFVQPTGDQGR